MIKSAGRTFALLDWDTGDVPLSKDPEATKPAPDPVPEKE